MLTLVHRQSYAVAIGEDSNVLVRELRQLVGNGDDALGRTLGDGGGEGDGSRVERGGKHGSSGLGLTESVVVTAPIGIWMIAALVVERMPLTTSDELAGSLEEFQRALMQTHGLHQHGTLTPRTGGAVQVVMGVPSSPNSRVKMG